MNLKKQELKHDLSIELLKHRVDGYALVSKYTEPLMQPARLSAENFVIETNKALKKLNNWYDHERGGLLMSKNSSRLFVALTSMLAAPSVQMNISSNIDEGESFKKESIKRIQKTSSEFYKSLLRDIGVREEEPKSSSQ